MDGLSTEHKGLTSWKKEPTLEELKADYTEVSKSQAEQVTKINQWLDYLNTTGAAAVKKTPGRSSVQPQLIRKQAEWRYAALSEPYLSTRDIFEVNPITHEDVSAAEQNALVLNNQFSAKIDRTRFIDSLVRAAVTEGTAIIRLGWKSESAEVEEPVYKFEFYPVANEEEKAQVDQLIQLYETEPDSFNNLDPVFKEAALYTMENGEYVTATIVSESTQTVEKLITNHPTVELCNYKSVYIDPTCEGILENASFIIHSFTTSLTELKKDGRYKNLNKIETFGMESATVTPEGDAQPMTFKDKPREKLTAYEYWGNWDINGDGIVVPIVATWVNNTLIRMEENPYPDKKPPFVVISYLPVRNSIYGESDGSLLQDDQRIVGALTRGMIDLVAKSANSQTGMAVNMLSPANKAKFHNGEDYEFNLGTDPRQGIFQHTFPEVPNSALVLMQQFYQDAESLTGVKAFSTGGGITGAGLGSTAAGVRSAMDAASKREMGILRRISNGIIQVGRKIIAMNAVFLDEEEVIRITNKKFVKVKRDDLAGNFDLSLTISTAEADDAKAQELAFMLQTMGNNMGMELVQLVLAKIMTLRKMPDLAKQVAEYAPKPDPMQQQLQQLEMEKLQAEIELLRAQAQEAGTKGMLNESKISVEGARANNLQNEADKKSLDYVQDEAGIKHNREIDLERAKGNIAMNTANLNNVQKAETELMKLQAAPTKSE